MGAAQRTIKGKKTKMKASTIRRPSTRRGLTTLGITREEIERSIPLTGSALTVFKTVTGWRTMEPTRQSTGKRMARLNVEPTAGRDGT